MGNKNRPSVNKRKREDARRERTQEKVQLRNQRAAERQERNAVAPGEDPDIAGMVPGPQPPAK